jgi:ACS family hexuronate transporter-like MFS transporter
MTARTIKALRWWMIGLIMLGAIVNYLTRATLGVAAPTVLADLHITTKEYGWITGAFQLGVMMQPVCGYVLDVIGLKAGFAIFATAWSLITMAHGLAANWPMLAALRGLLGIAEGSANPAGMKAVSEWFPAKERGHAGGVYNIGASVGSMLAPPLVAWAILSWNWRAAFVIAGALGFAWVALWITFYKSPDKHPALSDAERDYIASGQETHLTSDGAKPSILQLLKRRNFWGIALPRFLADPDLGHPGLLGAAVPDHRARLRSEGYRPVRLAAVRRRRPGLPVRPDHRDLPAEARRQPAQRPARSLHRGRADDDRHGLRRARREPDRRDRPAMPGRLRAPDACRSP